MFCSKCGKEISDLANFCPYCGEKIENAKTKEDNKDHSLTSMILGIISVSCCFAPFVSIVLGILAIIKSQRRKEDGTYNVKSKLGIIFGILGIVLNVFILLITSSIFRMIYGIY